MLYKKGDLLDVKEGIILHGCNAQGVMGSGVAKSFKERFRPAYEFYLLEYKQGDLQLGWISEYRWSKELILMSAITQEFYGRDKNVRYVDYEAIEAIFIDVNFSRPGLTVNIPKIGAGYGNGDWNVIEEIINSTHPRVVCWEL